MLIKDAIRRAGTAHEVCYLLTSYVETLQFTAATRQLPACVAALPVRGPSDIAARLAGLQAVRHRATGRIGGSIDCAVTDEALDLFRAALSRLNALDLADAADFAFDRRSRKRPDQALAA